MDPWQPTGQPYGFDITARKMAEQASERAAAALSAAQAGQVRTCRLASVKTALLLSIGGSTDLTVTWDTPMPSATYTVEPVAGPGILGNATLAVKSQTRDGCVITVTAGLAVAAGAVVFAHARTN